MRQIAGTAPSHEPQTWWARYLLPLCLALTLAGCATYGGGYDSYYPYDTQYYPYDYSYPYYYSPYYYYPQGYYYKPYYHEQRYDHPRGGSGYIERGKGGGGSRGPAIQSPSGSPGGIRKKSGSGDGSSGSGDGRGRGGGGGGGSSGRGGGRSGPN